VVARPLLLSLQYQNRILKQLIPLVSIQNEVFSQHQTQVKLLRLDAIHPHVNGNKHFKLKYNLLHAMEQKFDGILTFGGQYSNHIFAAAAATNQHRIKSVGIVVGNENQLTSTLQFAQSCGMKLHFVNRETYRQKDNPEFITQLKKLYPNHFVIPEGGSNELAIKGCAEIPSLIEEDFDYIITACGTGGTLAGLAKGIQLHQKAIGISVLKGEDTLTDFIKQLHGNNQLDNWKVITGYHFGGYAKPNAEVNNFIHEFYQSTGIKFEHIYTAKMMLAIIDLVQKNHFPKGSKIVALHTGGLQLQ
jgi:1-aminocyclopropane-1-carboxylate deaminase/D-cysteine desulfhydrase-like pyridoxal-dependent ACC family enzyme